MTELWWSSETAAYVGAVGGSAIGVLGAVLGPLSGRLAQQGRYRQQVVMTVAGISLAGVVLGCLALAALADAQPYHGWYPLALGGAITATVFGALCFVVRKRYAQAEARRLEAQQFRRG